MDYRHLEDGCYFRHCLRLFFLLLFFSSRSDVGQVGEDTTRGGCYMCDSQVPLACQSNSAFLCEINIVDHVFDLDFISFT